MVELTLPFPPSANRYWRHGRGRTYLSKEAKHYRMIVAGMVNMKPMEGPLKIRIDLYPSNRRRWDLDNRIKQLLDALEHAGVYKDDSQIIRIDARKEKIITGGECVVKIHEMKDED